MAEKTPGQVAYEAEAAMWIDGFDGEVRVYLPWAKLPPGDQQGYEAAARAAAAAERARILGTPVDNFGRTIAKLAGPEYAPEDRWDRGYHCAMREVAAVVRHGAAPARLMEAGDD